MKFLSFDCANKSLAYTYMQIDTEFVDKTSVYLDVMNKFQKSGRNHSILLLLYILVEDMINFIKFIDWGVIDVLAGRKVKEVNKADRKSALTRILGELPQPDDNTTILIERQPTLMNHKTTNVQNDITEYYKNKFPHSKIIIVDPKKKNKLNFTADNHIREKINDNYSRQYDANKQLAKVNMMEILKIFDMKDFLSGIKKSNYDDIADSKLQIFAYLLFDTNAVFDINIFADNMKKILCIVKGIAGIIPGKFNDLLLKISEMIENFH